MRAVYSQVHGRQVMSLLCHVASQRIQELLRAVLNKKCGSQKRIYYLCEGEIEKYAPLDHRLACLVMPNRVPWGRISHSLMDSYNLNSTQQYS